mgnify:CR=1 FL=1|jgi:hypothetical protein
MKRLLLTIFLLTSVHAGDTFHSVMYSSASVISSDSLGYDDSLILSNGKVEFLPAYSETRSFEQSVYHYSYRYGYNDDNYRVYGQLGIGTAEMGLLSCDVIFKLPELILNSEFFMGISIGTSKWIWSTSDGDEISLNSTMVGLQSGMMYNNFELGYRFFLLKGSIELSHNVYDGFDIIQKRSVDAMSELYIAYNF